MCKHLHAVRIVLERKENADGSVTETAEITERIQRKTYPQNWTAYNKAQVNEKRLSPQQDGHSDAQRDTVQGAVPQQLPGDLRSIRARCCNSIRQTRTEYARHDGPLLPRLPGPLAVYG